MIVVYLLIRWKPVLYGWRLSMNNSKQRDFTCQQQRGQLTPLIKIKSKELLGYEITTEELRLIPYIQFIACNNKRIEVALINSHEVEILSKWAADGYLVSDEKELLVLTREFWCIICEIMWLGYVDLS